MLMIEYEKIENLADDDSQNQQLRAEAWQALEESYIEGTVKSIGVVNYTESHLLMLLDNAVEKPHFNQFDINPFKLDEETISFCM